MKKLIFLSLLIFVISIQAQQWERDKSAEPVEEILFRSTVTSTYPTAFTLGQGDIEYEISHRFVPSISEGSEVNFGFDGPVNMRMALSYGLSDELMVTLGRSNLMDNYDLRFKYKLLYSKLVNIPILLSLQAGVALNSETPDILNRDTFEGDNFQYYVQGIFNAMFFEKKLGVGIVPSYLYNSMIFSIDKEYTFTLGTYFQYYLNRMFSFRLEYAPIIAGYHGVISSDESGRSYNSLSFSFDIETGGHVFQLLLTNNLRLNPSQYIVGANDSAASGDWHLGFGITRVF